MKDVSTDQVMAAVSRSPVIKAVERAAHELVGMRVLFMLRQHDEIVKLSPYGSEADLPVFCHILRSSGGGTRKCSACRALVAFGACYRGLTDGCSIRPVTEATEPQCIMGIMAIICSH